MIEDVTASVARCQSAGLQQEAELIQRLAAMARTGLLYGAVYPDIAAAMQAAAALYPDKPQRPLWPVDQSALTTISITRGGS